MSPRHHITRSTGLTRVHPPVTRVKPRDAASMIVWRDGSEGIEVLMGRRTRHLAFLPDVFVFPGGRIDPADYLICAAAPLDPTCIKRMGVRRNASLARALAIAAVRETFEESGLFLADKGDVGVNATADWAHWRSLGLAPGLHHLSYFGRAITPPSSPIRFHARFFLVRAEMLLGALAGSGELSELAFYSAIEVLAQMPIVDVTEFMLNHLITHVAASNRLNYRAPVFSYKNEVPFVRYE